jgi:hypothetical protein
MVFFMVLAADSKAERGDTMKDTMMLPWYQRV